MTNIQIVYVYPEVYVLGPSAWITVGSQSGNNPYGG
jgi:hypothetical protein